MLCSWRLGARSQSAEIVRRLHVRRLEGLKHSGAVKGMLMAPTLKNGKICYIEMPATDIARSADFYKKVFGWQNRKRGDGSTAFDDSVGDVGAGSPALGKARAPLLHHG